MSVFARMNTLRGSCSTCRSLENNFWNVDILLHHLRKQLQLVKRPISPGQYCPIKPAGPSVPMSEPGGLESAGNQKWPSLLFRSKGKKNRHSDQSVRTRRGTLPVQRPQWTQSLMAMSPCEKTSHCPVTELPVRRRRWIQHPFTVARANNAPLTLAWLGTAPACQIKQQLLSCQNWKRTLFPNIIAKEKIYMLRWSDGSEATSGELCLTLQLLPSWFSSFTKLKKPNVACNITF